MMLDRHGHVGVHTSHSMHQSPVVVLGMDLNFWEMDFSSVHLFLIIFNFFFSLDSQKGRKEEEENTN